MNSMQFILAVLFFIRGFFKPPVQGRNKGYCYFYFFIGSIVAATNDIAIDGLLYGGAG